MIFDQLDLFGVKARQRRAERAEDRAEREREREERRVERAENLEAAERAERAAERRHRELLAAMTGRDITGDGGPDAAAPGPEEERNH